MRVKAKLALASTGLLVLAALACRAPTSSGPTEVPLGAKATAEMPEADDGLDVYFRDTDLDAMSPQALVQYFDDEPGESTALERAYRGAPPQIPHTVEDMPIQTDENECLDCHHPDNVTKKEEIPMSDSHFEVPRMAEGKPGDAMVWKVAGYDKSDEMAGSRYNCSMCHTPQARSTRTPSNLFESTVPAP